MENYIQSIKNELSDYITQNEKAVKEGGINFSRTEKYGRLLLLNFFQENNIFTEKQQEYSITAIAKQLNIIPEYNKLYNVLLKILEKEGFVTITDNNIVSTELIENQQIKKNLNNLAQLKNDIISEFADMQAHLNLLDTVFSQFKDILRGEKTADGVLFPLFSLDLVKGIFSGNMLADYFNNLIAMTVKYYCNNLIEDKSKEDKIIIAEIGAGTGATSDFILKEINSCANQIEYNYTDISKVFVKKAAKKYRNDYPFVKCVPLDIEKDFNDQNFNENSIDIIIAANVLHATADINLTLKNCQKLLKKNGILIINEVVNEQDFLSLTFGLFGAWWKFTDEKIRIPNSPLLSIGTWKDELAKLNFNNIELISTSGDENNNIKDSFSQSLIFAQK